MFKSKPPQPRDWRAVGVLVVHGIGVRAPNFSAALQETVNRFLPREQRAWVRWSEVYWGDVTRPNQLAYLRAARLENRLDGVWGWLREWVLIALGDAAAYQRVSFDGQNIYGRIQEKMRGGLENLLDREEPQSPLVVIAHSLGGHIASTFIHDTLKAGTDGVADTTGLQLSPDERRFMAMQTLAGIVTIGCNIPLFTFAYPKPAIYPVRFPETDDPIATKRRWLNFYTRSDVLGYPLRPINYAYEEVVEEDIPVWTGVFKGATPFSHNLYWTNGKVCRRIGKMLSELITTPYPSQRRSTPADSGVNMSEVGS